MTSFAQCLDLWLDDLTDGQVENFLELAESGPFDPTVLEALRTVIQEARRKSPPPEIIMTDFATVAFEAAGGDSAAFDRWARAQIHKYIGSARPVTGQVTLQLATPAALRQGLSLFGLRWQPKAFDRNELLAGDDDTEPGLYCWVTANGEAHLKDPHSAGVLYIGIGDGSAGWRKRLHDEWSWITAEADHGHGMAMHRTNARVVGGPVSYSPRPLTWLTPSLLNDKGIPPINEYLSRIKGTTITNDLTPAKVAESIAIRLAIHLGDTGAPVNATGAGSWNTARAADWAGLAAARFLTT